ncbi:MAG: hypothetical protein FAF05_06365 [Epsilonproteobacteria bacterium]|nr:hypothetical protein [Campylobacterota bacterium]
MKKIILYTALSVASLFADVTTVLPFAGAIKYDADKAKSIKDRSSLYGVYANIGDLSYLLELSYTRFTAKYKTNTPYGKIEDLQQDDITLAYAQYFKNFMLRGGVHYINTNDIFLDNGIIVFAGVGGYNYVNYDKYSYGIESYYSSYKDGMDDADVKKSISIMQFTPYFSAYNVLGTNWGNLFSLKLNYQMTGDYTKDSYISYEASETLYYKSLFFVIKGYAGEMKTGVKDGGLTVMNTLDLMKNGYGFGVGYYLIPSGTLSLNYELNNYREYKMQEDGMSAVASFSFAYKF